MADQTFPIDFATLELTSKPNQFLVLPEGFTARSNAHHTSRVWRGTDPATLLANFKSVALDAPRTEVTNENETQVELCQKSALFKFPDFITLEAVEVPGGSALCVYSRSKVGYSDLGVNAKRIQGWLEQLDVRL